MRREALIAAIGGRNALTIWSWLVSVPLGIVAGALWGVSVGLTSPAWLLGLCLMHVVLVIPLALFAWRLRVTQARRPRPGLAALCAFGTLGAMRTAGIMVLAGAFGMADALRLAVSFIPYGAITGIVTFGVIAVVVDGVREHRVTMQRLSDLETSIAQAREADQVGFEQLQARVADEVDVVLAEALGRLRVSGDVSAEQASASLRTLAADVVRPLSHRLFEDEQAPTPAVRRSSVPRGRSARLLIEHMRPAPAWLIVLVIEIIALPVEFVAPRAGSAAAGSFIVLLGGAVMFALSWLVQRWWRPGATTIPRLVALTTAYFAVGAIATAVMGLAGQVLVAEPIMYWVTPILLALIAMGFSLLSALAIRRTATEDLLADYVVRESQLAANYRESLQRARRGVAKFLHSNLQAELIASAMSLAMRVGRDEAGGRVVIEEIDRMTRSISEQMLSDAPPMMSSRDRVMELTSLWAGVLDIEMNVNDDVWSILDCDHAALAAVDDVISEGLTNAVRHGDDSRVVLRMNHEVDAIVIRITSHGRIAAGARSGLGSVFLDDSARTWQLSEDSSGVHLTASIGVIRTPV